MYRIVLLAAKKRKRSAIKAQQILKTLVRNATFTMFQNKKLKHNATSAFAEVAKVVLCSSTCAYSPRAALDLHVFHFQACCLLHSKPQQLFGNQ